MDAIYNSLTGLFTNPTTFSVVESSLRKREDGTERYIVKLRSNTPSVADGISTEGSQITLYVSSLENVSGNVELNPSNWEFKLSPWAHPDTGEMINLKWLRVAR